jgi:predicted RND superfamily exporter protein
MRWLARLLVRRAVAWTVVVLSLALSGAGALLSTRVQHDDDILAFLPEGNEDVAAFRAINERFGGLEVALVGVEADPLDPEVFTRLQRVTKALNDSAEVELALSVANVDDFVPAPGGGIRTDYLVTEIPAEPAAQAALRAKVMSRDLVVGQLISPSGDAFVIYCFAAFGQDPKGFSAKVRGVVESELAAYPLYWGGAPFISTYIFSTTQEDLRKLTPWAVLAVVLLVFLAFRDVFGAGLALLSTGMGIGVSMGLMGLLGVRYNIVLSSMPVILFSVGSAYGIHVLARFYILARDEGRQDALQDTLVAVGPTVITAGLTTVCGLLSFLVMDIQPMRTFGLFTAVGIFATLVFALTFVPAVIVALGIGPRSTAKGRVSDALIPMVELAQTRRGLVGGALLLMGAVGAYYAHQVDTRMDQTAFFSPDSAPAQADRFLLQHFGGSQYIQVHLRGDFDDPHTLRELTRFADALAAHPKVAGVQHIAQVVAQTNEAMEGARRVPDDAAKVKLLYTFLAGRPAVDQLVTRDHAEAVLHVKLGTNDISDVEVLLADVEKAAARDLTRDFSVVPSTSEAGRARLLSYAVGRVRAVLARQGARLDGPATKRVRSAVAAWPTLAPGPVADELQAFLTGEESAVDLSEAPELAAKVAAAAAALGPHPAEPALEAAVDAALAGAAGRLGDEAVEEAREDLLLSLPTRLDEAWRRQVAAARAQAAWSAAGLEVTPEPRVMKRLTDELETLEAPTALVPAAPEVATGHLAVRVSGLPVLHRGMSRSATQNQIWSLLLALGMVVVILSLTYRSARLGLIAASPTVLTLLLIYGGMGWLGVHLDIGTSMLASIIIGAGVDYAVHLVSAWRQHSGPDAATQAVRETGPAIWTNALMVAAGFFLLTLGEARTLQNVGGLTAAAMLTAAVATFLAVPALMARARHPLEAQEGAPISKDNLLEG